MREQWEHRAPWELRMPRASGAPELLWGPLVNIDTTVQSTSDEDAEKEVDQLLSRARKVGGSHRKTAYALKENVGSIVRAAGVSNLVFFTPTLANEGGLPPDPDRAQACWRRMEKAVAEEWPGGGVRILERGGRTHRLHYHVMLDVGVDVRTGYDFRASRQAQEADPKAKWKLHRSANEHLRRVYAKLYVMARRAGFGPIFHCEPVRSEVEAIRTYLAKYICKHVGQRLVIDKGRRLVAYFGQGAQRREVPAANRFAFGGSLIQNVGGAERPDFRNGWAWIWRAKAKQWFAKRGIADPAEAKELMGPKWCYRCAESIRKEELSRYPYVWMAVMDGRLAWSDVHEAHIDPMDRDLEFVRAKRATPFAGIKLRTSPPRRIKYGKREYDPAEVLRQVAEMKPKRVRDEVCTIWADGTVEHGDAIGVDEWSPNVNKR